MSAEPRTGILVGRGLAVVALLANVVAVVLMALAGLDLADMFRSWFLHNLLVSFPLTVAFVVLLGRMPRHPVTWILGVSGVGGSLLQVLPIATTEWMLATSLEGAGSLTYGELPAVFQWLVWIQNWSWIPVVFVLPTLLLLRFPDGRLLGPRWRWAERASLAGLGLTTSAFALGYLPLLIDPATRFGAISEDELPVAWAEVLGIAGLPLMLVAVLLSATSIVLRARRADADTRRQIRWVASGLVLLGLQSTAFLFGPEGQSTFRALSLVAVPFIAASFPIAILKFRLYDIDVVITRAVTFGAMAAFVTGLYAVVVVGVGSLLGTTDDLGLSILATLAVAMAFEPVRARTHARAARLVYGDRATPYETIQQLSTREAHDASDDMDRLARAVASGTGAEQVVVWLRVRDALLPATVHGRVLGDDAPRPLEAELRGDLVAPVVGDDGMLGALALTKPRTEPVTEADRRLMADVTAAAVPLLTNVRLRAELARRADELVASRRRLVAAQDRARRRLERDLHDGAQQQVVALKVKLGLARTLAVRGGHEELGDRLAALADDTQQAVEGMRVVAHGIYPPLLATEGLETALAAAARRLTGDVTVAVDLPDRPAEDLESAVYFCVLETTGRLHDHGADEVSVRVTHEADTLRLDVTSPTAAGAIDLVPVEDRVGAFGGHHTSRVGPDGTCHTFTLPWVVDAAVVGGTRDRDAVHA